MSWVRKGECSQCGDCCKGRDPFGGELGEPPVAGFCALYRVVEGHGHCNGHDGHPYYLGGCNVWPTMPEHVQEYSRCTYTFEWVSGDGN